MTLHIAACELHISACEMHISACEGPQRETQNTRPKESKCLPRMQ